MNKKKFYIYSLILFTVFVTAVSFLGLFKIGILSDTFGDAYTAVNSTVADKITNNLEYIDVYRYRPVLFLTLKGIAGLNEIFGICYDNFILYKLINLFLYLAFSFTAGFIVLKISRDLKLSVLSEALVLIYPNNLHNLCWSAAYFEILCGVFYLLAFLFVIKYLNSGSFRFLIFSNILFILSLLTKEIAITFPFACIIILFVIYGKAIFKKHKIFYISQVSILLLYFISKSFLSKGIPIISEKYFESSFGINAIQIIFKGIISSLIPLDYLVLKKEINEINVLVLIYLIIIVIFALITLINLMKNGKYKDLFLIILNFLILISPFIYAGYIRPQLILLPFTILLISIFIIIPNKSSLYIRFTVAIIIFWLFWDIGVLNGWKNAHSEGKERIDNLLKTELPNNKKIVIVGNPARMQQYFMYDNIMFPYNYFKYQKFVIKDTITDLIRTVALDDLSLNSELNVSKAGNNEYEITCTGKTQFFYIDGNEIWIKEKKVFKNDIMTVELIEFNSLDKPVKIRLKILNDNTESYIYQGKKLMKLN